MANFRAVSSPKPMKIDRFLGLNTSVGETEIAEGELIYMRNFRITKNYKAEKRMGYENFINYGNTLPIDGAWHGTILTKTVLITINNGKVYEYNFLTHVNTQIGTIATGKCTIFYFANKIYFMNGTNFKEYNGTTFQDSVPYEPVVAILSPPTGGGTLFEETNLLTGAKWKWFEGNATANFTLAEKGIDATLVQASVNGMTKVESTDFTVNRTTGVVTFLSAPAAQADVKIRWVKVSTNDANLMKNHKYATTFGPSNDTNVFIWGNPNEKNVYRVSGTNKPTYFPSNSFYAVSANDYAITDLQPMNDRLLIFKENMAHYTYAQLNPMYGTNKGLNQYLYPSFDLNSAVGNITPNGVQLIENDPVSIKSQSVWRWTNTQIEDERNASIISDRVKEMLQNEDLKRAITFDYQSSKELWINIDGWVYIYNYGNNTWYVYDNIEADIFIEIDNDLYFGSNGSIKVFKGLSDDGVAVNAVMKTGFIDFGAFEYVKNSRDMWLNIEPATRTSVTVKVPTNRKNEEDPGLKSFVKGYRLFDFDDIDFSEFSFQTNRNPQTFRIKIKAKKYTFIQFIFSNNEVDETLVLLGFKVGTETSSFSK